jgi:hypothetical protein
VPSDVCRKGDLATWSVPAKTRLWESNLLVR